MDDGVSSNDISGKLLKFHASKNIADDLDDETKRKIADAVVLEFTLDKDSRSEWEETIERATEVANQTVHEKTFPWTGAANIKFPLMSSAAIQFAARTYPELIQDGRVVEAYVSGDDPDGTKTDRAARISAYMSYQLLMESDSWESDTDKLLHMLPIVGTVFRKTYYDPITKRPTSDVCTPVDIVIHNSAKSLESARRVSHLIYLYENDIVERINAGIFCDVDVKILQESSMIGESNKNDPQDSDMSFECIEQHRYWDLDGDGYKEPYIATVHKPSRTLLRLVARWDMNGIKFAENGKILSIKPVNYFTDYHFLRSFDGSFYSLGFGVLLYPVNQAIDSLFNQLLDAGTLSNLQSGIIGSGLRIQGGKLQLAPGEWKKIETMGADISANVFPLPVREPSQTLFNLLQLLIQAGKDLSGVVDILPEDQQTQNVPATTMVSLLDQRLKPLKAIFKRIYQAFKKEFDKLYRLNSIYLPDEAIYFNVLNQQHAIAKVDFKQPDYDVKPIADPSMASESQRIMKIELCRQALQQPGGQLLNPQEIMQRWVKELNMTNPAKLIAQPPPPQPSPEQIDAQIKMADIQRQAQKDQNDYTIKVQELQLKQQEVLNRKDLDEAKAGHLHAQSMLDIANSQREHHQKMTDHFLKLMDLVHQNTTTHRSLDIEEQGMKNDNANAQAGLGSPSGNGQTS